MFKRDCQRDWKILTVVCINIYMQHIWTIFNENTHACERRRAIEINETENIDDIYIFVDTISFPLGTKTDFLQRIIMVSDDIFSPLRSHLEYLAQFFNVIIQSTFMSVAMQNPCRLIFYCIETRHWQAGGVGVSKEEILGQFE